MKMYRSFFTCLLAVVLAAPSLLVSAQTQPSRPNIIFVLMDDLRWEMNNLINDPRHAANDHPGNTSQGAFAVVGLPRRANSHNTGKITLSMGGGWAGFEHFIAGRPEFRLAPRHTLYSGPVGGPDWNEVFDEMSSIPARHEVALDFNAGLTCNLARLAQEFGGQPLADFPPVETATEGEFLVEAKINASGNDFSELRTRINNRFGWLTRDKDKLSFRYLRQVALFHRIVFAVIHNTSMPRRLQATVRSQLESTRN